MGCNFFRGVKKQVCDLIDRIYSSLCRFFGKIFSENEPNHSVDIKNSSPKPFLDNEPKHCEGSLSTPFLDQFHSHSPISFFGDKDATALEAKACDTCFLNQRPRSDGSPRGCFLKGICSHRQQKPKNFLEVESTEPSSTRSFLEVKSTEPSSTRSFLSPRFLVGVYMFTTFCYFLGYVMFSP